MDIRWLKGSEDLSDAFEIRKQVFIKEQKVPEELEWDELDKECKHIVIYSDGEAVATGRIVIQDNQHFLGRIAVLKEYRGKGLGKVLVEEMLKKLFTKKVEEVFIHAQVSALGFYENIGFKAYGEIFEDAGIDHIHMSIRNYQL